MNDTIGDYPLKTSVGIRLHIGHHFPEMLMSRFALGSLEDNVRVDDLIRKSVVYVGDAGSGTFVPLGTGFIAASNIGDLSYQSVVTAKHVLDGMEGRDIHLRLNLLLGAAVSGQKPTSEK